MAYHRFCRSPYAALAVIAFLAFGPAEIRAQQQRSAGPAPATSVAIGRTPAVATDSSGNVYFIALLSVFKLDPNGLLTRVAGVASWGFSGDGGPATSAQLDGPTALAAGRDGSLYIAEGGGHIRKVGPDGTITTIAGNGACHGGCFNNGAGDGGPATSVALFYPYQLAVDAVGNVYIGEWNTSRIRRVSADGTITTVVGNGNQGYSGDGGQATDAQIGAPWGLSFDNAGNLYFSDAIPGDDIFPVATHIRKVSPDGFITTVAGTGDTGDSGDGGLAANAQFIEPGPLANDGNGNLYIADGPRVRMISADGIITTFAGNGTSGFSGDGGPAGNAAVSSSIYGQGLGLATDASGNLYIADTANYRIRKVGPDGTITTIAGNGGECCYTGDSNASPAAGAGTH